MRYSQLVASLFLFTFAVALPAPAPEAASAAQGNRKGDGLKNSRVVAAGIEKNIHIQKQEKVDAKGAQRAEGSDKFGQAKDRLLHTIKNGEKVREKNQRYADKSNKELVNGLRKVSGEN